MNTRPRTNWIEKINGYWSIVIIIAAILSASGVIYSYANKIEELDKRTSQTELAITEMNKSLSSMDKSLAVIAEKIEWICKRADKKE